MKRFYYQDLFIDICLDLCLRSKKCVTARDVGPSIITLSVHTEIFFTQGNAQENGREHPLASLVHFYTNHRRKKLSNLVIKLGIIVPILHFYFIYLGHSILYFTRISPIYGFPSETEIIKVFFSFQIC